MQVRLVLVTFLLSLTLVCPVAAAPATSAASAVLMDGDTGRILYAQDENTPRPMASTTKLMTALVAVESLGGDLARPVKIQPEWTGIEGTSLYLRPGEILQVETLLYGLLLHSGNDAAVALAEKVAGVHELFVEQMNRRASELGMADTHFVNCTGLTAEGHVTSAHDIALMSRELLLHHPDIRRFTTIWMDTIRDGAFQLANTNKLIRFYDGATGLKTGYTASAGYCISATAERDGMELIAVIMKAPDKDTRTKDAKALLNYGFSTYALVDALPPEPLTPVAVAMGASDAVQPVPEAENTSVLVEKAKAGGLTRTVTLEPQVAAPVEAGQRLGELSVLDGGTVLLTVPLVAEEAVARRSWGQVFTQLLRMAVFAA